MPDGGRADDKTEISEAVTLRKPDTTSLEDAATVLPGTSPSPFAISPVQPMSATLDEFKRSLVETGLIERSELEWFAAQAPGGVLELARSLVQAGKLTPYQAAAVNQGKTKGLVIGNYFVLDKLGAGGMGVVFKAKHRRLGRVVALKILPPSFTKDHDMVLRFRREVDAAARLKHPNVISAVDADEDRGVHYLAMDYIDGRDLDRLIADRGPLPVDQALDCVIQAARGLEAAHSAGIIHRDIKPGNLMLDGSGNVLVLDLGLARFVEASNPFGHDAGPTLTKSGSYMGTVDYMAPEQAEDSKRVDGRADIYSLGCTLYFLLTGKAPFESGSILKRLMAHQERPAPSLLAARPGVPRTVEDVYQAMMAKRPNDRPATMAEVIARLEAGRALKEADRAQADLKDLAEEAVKRASPRTSKGRDPSVLARHDDSTSKGIRIDNELSFEDLVMDLREDIGPAMPATEVATQTLGRIKPAVSRIGHRRKLARGKPLVAVGALVALVLIVVGLRSLRSPDGPSVAVAGNAPPVAPIVPKTPPEPPKAVEAPINIPTREMPRDIAKAGKAPFDFAAWGRSVAAMPASQQVEAVASRLKDLNSGFDGAVTPTIRDGVVTGLRFSTDRVSDISPVSVLSSLRKLEIQGSNFETGEIVDLSPLKGMALSDLSIDQNRISDLTPLRGMPLEHLSAWQWRGSDLSPLRGMPLKRLNCGGGGQKLDLSQLAGLPLDLLCINHTKTSDLAPLKDMKLSTLMISNTPTANLAPLKGMQLHELHAVNVQASDLTPLQGMPLTLLELEGARRVTDLHPLQGMKLTRLNIRGTHVADLAPLKGMKLHRLEAQSTPVSDLTPLRGMPLTFLDLYDAQRVTDLQPLRGMPLQYLNVSRLPKLDLSVLKGMTSLRTLVLSEMKQRTDLAVLHGLNLKELCIDLTDVSDLSPLRGMSLNKIRLTPKKITHGLDILRHMQSLKTVAVDDVRSWPAAEFWDRYDKGDFR